MASIINNSVILDTENNILRFRVAAGNGDHVYFPLKATTDRVTVVVPNYYDGNVFNVCGVTRDGCCDRYGFTLSKLCMNLGTFAWNTSEDPVDVIVYAEGWETPDQADFLS